MALAVSAHVSNAVDAPVNETHFYSTGELFRVSSTLKAVVVLAIRGDTEQSGLSNLEENSITIPIAEVNNLIRGLQEIVESIHKQNKGKPQIVRKGTGIVKKGMGIVKKVTHVVKKGTKIVR